MKNNLLFVCWLFLFACQSKLPALNSESSKIVINALITTDSLFGVTITRSSPISANEYNEWIQDAIVTIRHGEIADCLLARQPRLYLDDLLFWPTNYYSKDMLPEAGFEYEIEVQCPEMQTVVANTTIPGMVKIAKLDTTRIVYPEVENPEISNLGFLCQLSFIDPQAEENFYMLQVILHSTEWGYFKNLAFICGHSVVEEEIKDGLGTKAVVFSDKSINGKEFTLPLEIKCQDIGYPFRGEADPYNPHGKATIYFRLYSMNKEYFTYIQTLNLFYKNYRNPLAEPAQVYSNVEGGYGIFAGAAVTTDSLVFKY